MLCGLGHTVTTCCEAFTLCWVLLAQISVENDQIFHATFVDVAFCCCGRFAMFMQRCWTSVCALVRFSIPGMSQNVATGWPNARNLLCLTMLRYVTLNCCDRLAGASKCLAKYVAICCVYMLRWFVGGFKVRSLNTPEKSELFHLWTPWKRQWYWIQVPHVTKLMMGLWTSYHTAVRLILSDYSVLGNSNSTKTRF